jgi:hypothetical protein
VEFEPAKASDDEEREQGRCWRERRRGFLHGVDDVQRRADAHLLVDLMQEATGEPAVLWGTAIVGFELRHYRYAAGIEDDIAAVSFSPRKARTALYLSGGLDEYNDLRLSVHDRR